MVASACSVPRFRHWQISMLRSADHSMPSAPLVSFAPLFEKKGLEPSLASTLRRCERIPTLRGRGDPPRLPRMRKISLQVADSSGKVPNSKPQLAQPSRSTQRQIGPSEGPAFWRQLCVRARAHQQKGLRWGVEAFDTTTRTLSTNAKQS